MVTRDYQLLLIVAHRYYIRGAQLKRKLKYTEKAGVVASWLLHHNQYVSQYCSECYNRDMHNLEK